MDWSSERGSRWERKIDGGTEGKGQIERKLTEGGRGLSRKGKMTSRNGWGKDEEKYERRGTERERERGEILRGRKGMRGSKESRQRCSSLCYR